MTTAPVLSTPVAARQVAALLRAPSPLTPWQATEFRTGWTDAPAARITDGTRTVIAAFHPGHTTLAWARRGDGPTYPRVAVPATDPALIAREILRSALPDIDTEHARADGGARPAREFLEDELRDYFADRGIPTSAWRTHNGTIVRVFRRGPALIRLKAHMTAPTLDMRYGGPEFFGGTLADLEQVLRLVTPVRPRGPYKVLGDEITGQIPRRLCSQFSHADMRQLSRYGCLVFGRNVGPEGQIETPEYRARARDDAPVCAYVNRLGLDFTRSILDALTGTDA
ncbi:hypothetical protein ABT033_31340 [Streptomyces pharetrae]|uniref:hypothetical protein n=1 Tax=Streptomyces pharetrae TaxID=291370 RepID=UPI003362ADE8